LRKTVRTWENGFLAGRDTSALWRRIDPIIPEICLMFGQQIAIGNKIVSNG
jgi:hypothetical protein